ncbi:hypothetical protein LIER_12121 [Lithospermum erythrorhizon]|uniref:Uncharacterized protein n=1 Tax=Lithospermum erythrorhizon TaxID=34254 RepID=A0AAV3PQK7_LITER
MSGGSNQEIPSTSAQEEVVPPRPDSPIMVMEPDTLAFFRLYTTVGCGSGGGEPAYDEDLGGNPLDSGVIYAEPLSVHPPSSSATESSQARSTPLVPQYAKTAQGGRTANKPGDIPIVIRYSLPVDFSEEDLDNFRQYFSIPSFLEMHLPLEWKRPAPSEARPPLFSKRHKSIARKLPHSEILDLTVDRTSSNVPDKESLDESTSQHPSTSDSLPDEGSDSAPRAKATFLENYLDLPYTLPGSIQINESSTLWKKSDAFRASVPSWLDVVATLAIKEKKEATSQAISEIKKHDALEAWFNLLKGEHFDLTQKLERLQLVHNQTTKKVSELEDKVKSVQHALPQQVQRAIFEYQRSAEFRLEAGNYEDFIVANFEDFI